MTIIAIIAFIVLIILIVAKFVGILIFVMIFYLTGWFSRIVYELDHRRPVLYLIPNQNILGNLPVVCCAPVFGGGGGKTEVYDLPVFGVLSAGIVLYTIYECVPAVKPD